MSPQSPQDWAEEQAARVAQEVRRLRRDRGRSAQWLADRTAELGYTVTRPVIADLENGRRKYVTTAELVVLARALNTTPIALLYPDPVSDDEIKMLPTADVSVSSGFALQWFSGLVDVPTDFICDDAAEYLANLKPVETARQIWELDGQKAALMKEGLDKSGKEKREILLAIAQVQRQIDKLRGTDGG
ncbi:helix-turn-helix domain-containing protein [Mycobacterium fragae]|uniref:HTH cro/C1-type domain-containing protein n=1 Tax=Mycobacterium fragae TaxID=1260918 RepID=A0A1X1V2Z6_9MYCO|nr:helix-turn-helix domain-containing protein [Mycobacterium fragae]ORV63466.1 hypothetical protein AWC06_09000 [Mycobacterium fragae]